MAGRNAKVNTRQTEIARSRFGDKAIAFVEPAVAYRSGRCSACLKPECRRKNRMVIAVHCGFFLNVKGQGHTWKDAWAQT